jgi:glycosyltransferase involved in cell wall biosynthesis
VVLTDVGGAAEQVEQGVHGYRVPVSQPDAVAAHFVTLWRDGAAQRLGDQARERVRQEFSLQRMLDDYARLFEEGVTASAAPSLATVRSSMPQS